jgi:hypothetical protein
MIRPSLALRVLLTGLAASVAGCDGPARPLTDQQQAVATCRAEADRIYNVQNRDKLSEQDNRDTPLSANATPDPNSQVLADQYAHDQMIDNCLNHADPGPDLTPAPPASH